MAHSVGRLAVIGPTGRCVSSIVTLVYTAASCPQRQEIDRRIEFMAKWMNVWRFGFFYSSCLVVAAQASSSWFY